MGKAASLAEHAGSVVTWEGPGEPIMSTLYGPAAEVALPLLPKRALTLAQELLTCGVQAIKADSWDAMYEQGTPQRARRRCPGGRASAERPVSSAGAEGRNAYF